MELASAAAQIIPVWPDSDDSTRAAVDKVLATRVAEEPLRWQPLAVHEKPV